MVERRGFTWQTAVAVVVANMVGTGVFTSLGYQLVDLQSPFVLLLLWLVGGVVALCGALTYAELGSQLPRSGGEYHFLGQIYHPALGFVSGWISVLVGFAAPTALASMTFAAYLDAALPDVATNRMVLAMGLVAFLTVFHAISHQSSSMLQNGFTLVKVILIVVFCALVGWFSGESDIARFQPVVSDTTLVFSGAFAVSLIYVNYAYTGWNAATYLTSELASPEKNLPRVLVLGTMLVMGLYLLLNFMFLYSTPQSLMVGKIEIGVIVANHVFGAMGGTVMGFVLSLLLVSTVSAMTMAGPRVLQVMGEDHVVFRWLADRNQSGVPARAIFVQSSLTLLFIATATFESILVFSGFILGINSLLAVAGIFVLRRRSVKVMDAGYRTWGYPVTPLIYITLSVWTLAFITVTRPLEAGLGLAILATGLIAWVILGRWS